MRMTQKIFDNLVKYHKIDGWWIQIFNDDWLYLKPSDKKGFAYFQNVAYGDEVEWKISDIISIGDMKIEHWLESVDCNLDGNLNYLEISEQTDYNNDIKGKVSYTYNSIPFVDNMTVVFKKDVDENIRNKLLKVTGVGTGIELKRMKGRPRFAREL